MRTYMCSKRHGRKGVTLILVTLLLLVLIPIIGLAIDGGILYLLKARLSQATDAAALAGARALGGGSDSGSAEDAANRYFQANFPANYWGCTVPPPVVSVFDGKAKIRYVTVSASAVSPLYFLRLIGKQTANIAATAQASRRDVNVILVLDRSSSMGAGGALPTAAGQGGSWPILNAATWFVNQFTPGRDNVGLVVFGGEYYIRNPSTGFQSNIVSDIGKIVSSGRTGAAQALWVAYNALYQLNQPNALNAILFFTDGLPNGITADFLNLRNAPAICAPNATSLLGWIGQNNGFLDAPAPGCKRNCPATCPGPNCVRGLFKPGPLSTVSDPSDGEDSEMISGAGGCQFTSSSDRVYLDFQHLPAVDYYGNLTNPPNPYKPVTLTSIGLPSQVGAASANAADYAARRMRNGALGGIVPLIDSIGLITNQGETPDDVFMKRVSNTPDSPIYNRTKPTGMYILANNQDQLQAAFREVASQILRLSQ